MGRRTDDGDDAMAGTRPIGELLKRFASTEKPAAPASPPPVSHRRPKPPRQPRLKEEVASAAAPLEQMSLVFVFEDGMRVAIPATSRPEFRQLEVANGGGCAVRGTTIALDRDTRLPDASEDPVKVLMRERTEAAARNMFLKGVDEFRRNALHRALGSLKGVVGNDHAAKHPAALAFAKECVQSFLAEAAGRDERDSNQSEAARYVYDALCKRYGVSPWKISHIRKNIVGPLLGRCRNGR